MSSLRDRHADEEQPWHMGRSTEPLRVGLVVEMHPSWVPLKGEEWMYRDETAGTNWIGVRSGHDAVRIVRPA